MKRRSGFTLMELLLVVAVLAIVAAAAAPTFFGGAADAMDEAKRSRFLSAYSNTLSGANMHMSILTSKGITPSTTTLVASMPTIIPTAARTFNVGGTAGDRLLTPRISGTNVEIYSVTGTADTAAGGNKVSADASWTTIKTY